MPFRFILILALIVAAYGCQNCDQQHAVLDVHAYESMLTTTEGVQLIDVRTPEEFNAGHLLNARMIDWNSPDFDAQASRLDKQKPLMLYCAVGGRSAQAAARLKSMGFQQITDMKGGFNAWKAAGKPVVLMSHD